MIQGSVLGPPPFLLYVNDLFHVVRSGVPFLFADDIKIVYTFQPEALGIIVTEVTRYQNPSTLEQSAD